MKALYKQYPFRSAKKLLPLALKHGISKYEVMKFLNTLPKDIKFTKQRQMMLPIYSEHKGAYQFDTLVQTNKAKPRYFIIFINVNSRKLYAYPMSSKDSKSVKQVLEKFINDNNNVTSLTSDQDKAYLSHSITNLLLEHNIDHQTTLKNDHNRLGIINRAIKTLRDLNDKRDFTIASMNKAVNAYNNTVHSSIGKEPNQFTKEDEYHYINKMRAKTDNIRKQYRLTKGLHVRIIDDQKTIGKKRSNLSSNSYIIDDNLNNKYIVRAKDGSISEIPRYRLVVDNKATLANTIDNSRRGIVDKILSYDNKHYNVKFKDGTIDRLPVSYMREGRPTRLSPAEIQYWKTQKQIPTYINAFKAYHYY